MAAAKLTLDTNLIHEYLKQRRRVDVVRKLLCLANQGIVELAVTAPIHEDVPCDPLASRLNELPDLGITFTGTVARVGEWVLGRDMLGDDGFAAFPPLGNKLAQRRGKNPPDSRDWAHLHAHFLLKRDVFLTWDGGILCLAPELEEQFGVVVMKPEDYIQSLDS